MNDATKRTADAPPAGEDAPIAKKPSVELFQNEADKKSSRGNANRIFSRTLQSDIHT